MRRAFYIDLSAEMDKAADRLGPAIFASAALVLFVLLIAALGLAWVGSILWHLI